MTDLELINLASKASGFEYTHNSNPLHDDALALQLAVKLGIKIEFFDSSKTAFVEHPFVGEIAEEVLNTDPYAATRRAITRAAAEIGKAMP